MAYTREMERQFLRANDAVCAAEEARRPLKIARDRLFEELGDLLLHCPQKIGTNGAATWAISHADELTALLSAFVTQGDLVEMSRDEIKRLVK